MVGRSEAGGKSKDPPLGAQRESSPADPSISDSGLRYCERTHFSHGGDANSYLVCCSSSGEFPGGPVVKAPSVHCRGHGFSL